MEIVENLIDDASLPKWELGPPVVSIGSAEGEEATQLHDVTGALYRQSEIIILNGGSGELRFFDRSGHYLRSFGRKGEGPGEFRSAYWLGSQNGDSIAVYDFGLRRLSVFSRDGTLGRVSRLGYRGGQIAGRLADGTFVVRPALVVGRPEDVRPGIVRDSLPILLVSDDDEHMDTLAFYPGQEVERVLTGAAASEHVGLRVRPFGKVSAVAAADTLIYGGAGERWEIDVIDSSGRLIRSIRRRIDGPMVTDAIIARYRESRLASIADENARRAVERSIGAAPFPERLPPYGTFRVDDLGQLWVQDYRITAADSTRWTIFDPSGGIVGRITLPPAFSIYQSGTDFILARTRDDLDVEQIVLYSLKR